MNNKRVKAISKFISDNYKELLEVFPTPKGNFTVHKYNNLCRRVRRYYRLNKCMPQL